MAPAQILVRNTFSSNWEQAECILHCHLRILCAAPTVENLQIETEAEVSRGVTRVSSFLFRRLLCADLQPSRRSFVPACDSCVCPDVPSAPSAISLLLCSGSEMVLGWRAPSCHGGSPVQGYYLDQREKGTETWREVNVKPAKKRQFKVSDALNSIKSFSVWQMIYWTNYNEYPTFFQVDTEFGFMNYWLI